MTNWESRVRSRVALELEPPPTDAEWRLKMVVSLLRVHTPSPREKLADERALEVKAARPIAMVLGNLRAEGWQPPGRINQTWSPGSPQWELMHDLRRAQDEGDNGSARGRNALSLTIEPWWLFGQSATSVQPRISIEFDHRLSQREFIAKIRTLWPRLIECGWLRQTRPLQPRAVALVRHVCLDSGAGTSWAERMRVWNEEHRARWLYGDVRLFQRDFRRAEEQLTGDRYGLERFYNPIAILGRTELTERCAAGEKEALDYVERDLRRTRDRQERNKTMADCTALEELR